MSSSQKQHYRWGLDQNLAKFKRIYGRASGLCRKTKTDDLKISVRPELGALSRREISDVRQKMGAVNYESVIISGKVSKGGLHSILFDNINNKGKKQILGVILDTCSHFIRKRSRNSRYITFSSNLNESRSFNQNESYETCISEGSDSRFSGFRFKKINISFAALLVFAMCFFVSCGDSAKPVNGNGDSVSNFGKLGGECYPNETCDKGLLCDTENNICIEDPDNPTDTEQNEHDNNHNINDNQWEQPDENHNENPDNQWEQPDENHNENPDNQWEQPDQDHNENPNDQDNQWEQPDENHQETPDEQNNEGKCDPGYVWVDFDLEPYLSSYEDFINKQCASCKTTPGLLGYLEGGGYYCPGGDDLKGKRISEQMARCPQYTYVNSDYSDCICTYGVPPPGKTCAYLVNGNSGTGNDPNIQEYQCGETTEYQDDQEKCDPGYFFADYSIDPWLSTSIEYGINDGKYYNNQCAPCISVKWATDYMYDTNYFCPGGYISDLKHKSIRYQIKKCPDNISVNSDLSACECS